MIYARQPFHLDRKNNKDVHLNRDLKKFNSSASGIGLPTDYFFNLPNIAHLRVCKQLQEWVSLDTRIPQYDIEINRRDGWPNKGF